MKTTTEKVIRIQIEPKDTLGDLYDRLGLYTRDCEIRISGDALEVVQYV